MIEILKKEAEKIIEELRERYSCILGLSISGSISLGLADEFSDIDIDVWLNEEDFKIWEIEETCPLIEHFSCHDINREMPTNFSFIKGGYKFDIAIHSVERVRRDVWKIEQKANRKSSIIVHDTNNIIKELIRQKTENKKINLETKEKYSSESPCSEEYYNFFISAYLNYFCPLSVARKSYEQGHLNLNRLISFILEYLWVKDYGYFPYVKSQWAIVKRRLTGSQQEILKQASLIKFHSEEDVNRRRILLRELCTELNIPITKFYHHKTSLE